MTRRNENLAKLPAGYLFPEIDRRRRALLERNPQARIVSLGVGNTTQPLTPHIAGALQQAALALGTEAGYSGYGDVAGMIELRRRIAQRLYGGIVDAEEVFISDGAKCDCGRVQALFGGAAHRGPRSRLSGLCRWQRDRRRHGQFRRWSLRRGRLYDLQSGERFLSRSQEFAQGRPDLLLFAQQSDRRRGDAVQLAELVAYAKANRAIVIFDSAYSEFIRDESLPRSIFEIEGAREVAMEISSFSKMVGFTGVRLGWSVVPKELTFDDGHPVIADWSRIVGTIFNGASNIAQHGGIAALDDEGLAEMKQSIDYYLENARIIKRGLDEATIENYGGVNGPYIWARFPGRNSWDVFAEILEEAHVVVTPGAGFGPAGEEFIRFSAFGHREDVLEAVRRLRGVLERGRAGNHR